MLCIPSLVDDLPPNPGQKENNFLCSLKRSVNGDAGDEQRKVVKIAHSHPDAVEIMQMIYQDSIGTLIQMRSRLKTDIGYFEVCSDDTLPPKQQIFVARELLEDGKLLEMVEAKLKAFKKSLE